MIRAVIDANVLAAMLPAHDGTLLRLIDRLVRREFRLVSSQYILTEVERAWLKPYWRNRLSPEAVRSNISALRGEADIVELSIPVTGIAAHPEDDPILATALNGHAHYIVTGDKELLRLRVFRKTEIVAPRDFLTRLDEASAP